MAREGLEHARRQARPPAGTDSGARGRTGRGLDSRARDRLASTPETPASGRPFGAGDLDAIPMRRFSYQDRVRLRPALLTTRRSCGVASIAFVEQIGLFCFPVQAHSVRSIASSDTSSPRQPPDQSTTRSARTSMPGSSGWLRSRSISVISRA